MVEDLSRSARTNNNSLYALALCPLLSVDKNAAGTCKVACLWLANICVSILSRTSLWQGSCCMRCRFIPFLDEKCKGISYSARPSSLSATLAAWGVQRSPTCDLVAQRNGVAFWDHSTYRSTKTGILSLESSLNMIYLGDLKILLELGMLW